MSKQIFSSANNQRPGNKVGRSIGAVIVTLGVATLIAALSLAMWAIGAGIARLLGLA